MQPQIERGNVFMFWCLPSGNKCEWSTLEEFVKHFNTQFGTHYSLVDCPDVFNKTTSQPEVLLEDGKNKCMVIERKGFPWPSNYIRFHQLEHEFGNCFTSKINLAFQDDVYLLGISARHLRKNKKQVENIAQQIAEAVMEKRGQISSTGQVFSAQPVPWRFWRLSEFERDENTPECGVGVMMNDPWIMFQDLQSHILELADENTLAEISQTIRQKLEKLLVKVELKFKDYSNCLRVLLVDIYGDDLSLDFIFIDEIIQTMDLSLNIDQIWIAEPEWISEVDFKVTYRQIKATG
ncbi:MAG: hypothetical protein IAE79_26860 [Anaerolinea sp.]|nr:hypothetical protein [Anaerolinea sp.]